MESQRVLFRTPGPINMVAITMNRTGVNTFEDPSCKKFHIHPAFICHSKIKIIGSENLNSNG